MKSESKLKKNSECVNGAMYEVKNACHVYTFDADGAHIWFQAF